MSHEEWRVEKQQGRINAPGTGMVGHLNTYSQAPTGPSSRRSGMIGAGYNGSNPPDKDPWFGQQYRMQAGREGSQPSQYRDQRSSQPPPWIDDVDMASIWYSPMEPVWPFGPPYYNRPREWSYPVGYNLNYIQPRMELMGQLRGMRASWGLLSTVETTRQDQLLRLPWTIQRRDKPRASSKTVDSVRKFFRRPDGKLTYGQWSRKLMFDLFDIDSPYIYMDRDRTGKLQHVEVLDGATIFPLIDDAGKRPSTEYHTDDSGIVYLHRQPAFQQIIYGLPMINLSEDELIYAMMRPRPEAPMFGYSPVEQIMVEAMEGIRKTFYQLEFWRSGSMPELIITVPDAWTPKQIAMFQAHFDALLSGQLSLKSKVRFVPGGMKPFDIKNASGESLWSQRDELLARLVCFAFSIPPTPFVRQMNRATAQTAQQTAQEEGLYPLMSWWKDDIMDTIIQEKLGYEDIEFVFLPRPEVDLLKQAQIHQIKIHSGEMLLDEARDENGQEPYPHGLGQTPLIYFGSGAVKLEDVLSGKAVLPGSPTSDNQGQGPKTETSARESNSPIRGPAKPHGASPLPQPGKKFVKATFSPCIGDMITVDGDLGSASNAPWTSRVIEIDGTRVKVEYDDGEAWYDFKSENLDDMDHETEGHTHWFFSKSFNKVSQDKATQEQRKAGNYKKDHIRLHGLDISIENPKGSVRSTKDEFGRGWEGKMPVPYGYIRGTLGADGEQMDVFLGKKKSSPVAFVIDQDKISHEGLDQGFDEHKIAMCYLSLRKVLKDYFKANSDGKGPLRCGTVTRLSIHDLKSWLRSCDPKKPISEQGVGQVVYRRGIKSDTITKSDTISSSTGHLWHDQGQKKKKRKKKSPSSSSGPRWLELRA